MLIATSLVGSDAVIEMRGVRFALVVGLTALFEAQKASVPRLCVIAANLKAAKALGLTIPASNLGRVEEVIE